MKETNRKEEQAEEMSGGEGRGRRRGEMEKEREGKSRMFRAYQKLCRGRLLLVARRGWGFGYLSGPAGFVLLALRSGGTLTLIPGTGRVHLVGQILLLRLIKQLLLVLVRNDLGAVTQENNPTLAHAKRPRALHLHLIVIGLVLELVPDSRAAELGYSHT